MAAIEHFYAECLSDSTSSGTYADVSGLSFANTNFANGKKYLIIASAKYQEVGTGPSFFRLAHGGTGFDGVESGINSTADSVHNHMTLFTVWTANGTDSISLQFAANFSGPTVNVHHATLLIINLSDDLVENTDWLYNERTTDDDVTGGVNGATVTFTPAQASTWLVMSNSTIATVDATTSATSQCDRTGEAISTISGIATAEGTSTSKLPLLLVRALSLGAASNTFTEHSSTTSGAHTRIHSQIFALNLDKFRGARSVYTAGSLTATTGAYADAIQSDSITPAVAGDVWCLGSFLFDKNNASNHIKFRMQIDGTDKPDTADEQMRMGQDSRDVDPYSISVVANLDTSSHTVELEGQAVATTSTPVWTERSLILMPFELAPAGLAQPFTGPFGRALKGVF